jgi:hypothetical protein
MAFPSGLEISRATLRSLAGVGAAIEFGPHLLEPHGDALIKVKLAAIVEQGVPLLHPKRRRGKGPRLAPVAALSFQRSCLGLVGARASEMS